MGDAAEPRELRRTFLVPAIKPFDHYDFARAKVACSLAWLVAKAFGSEHAPEELREPFYTDQYEQEHIKPPVVQLLLSAELYCRAGSLILRSDAAKPLVGHDAVVQALAQKGLYVTDQERLVTERDLQRRPIQMSAHLAMMDTLMMAYTAEMVSVEKVIACAQRYCPCFQATDLPYDLEDAVTYWINKVNEHLKDILEQEQKLKEHPAVEAPGGQKSPSKWFWKLVPARYRREQALRPLPCIPPVENLLKDGADGCALAALIHFYCPGVLRLEDVCLKETMSLADSLYNLQLVQDFCQEHLTRCCHFALEDMLYASASIKSNYLVFMAELFWWFEVVKPSFVQPRVLRAHGAEPASPALDARASTTDSSPSPESAEGDVFPHPHHLPSRHSRSQPPASGGIRRSSSMSYVDGFIGTWPKEKRSSVHGVSFDISFDKENTAPRSAPARGIPRSVSNEGLSLSLGRAGRPARKSLTFRPVNGEGEAGGIEEELGAFPAYVPHPAPPKLGSRENRPRLPNGALPPGLLPGGEPGGPGETPPSIEEALQIIHDTERRPLAAPPGHGANGFFLHSRDPAAPPSGLQLRPPSPAEAPSPGTDDTEVDTGIHVPSEDLPGTVDEDSSLRDYTVSLDSDSEDAPKLPREAPSPCPSSASASSGSGVRMTSFAEQKFRKLGHTDGRSSGSGSQKTTPEGSELNIPHVVGWAPGGEDAGAPGRDSAQLLASEVLQLRLRLEEKRRAIEAQKRQVEAAFTRRRQRVGRTAFLSVVKRRGDGAPAREEAAGAEDKRAFGEPRPPGPGGQRGPAPADANAEGGAPAPWPPSPGDAEGPGGAAAEGEELQYTRSIEKLNASLAALQQEMQRLARQQEALLRMRDRQAWAVSPPPPAPRPAPRDPRDPRDPRGPRPGPPAPPPPRRGPAPPAARSPRPRPGELRVPPLTRTLAPPRSVDSLPRLRRFSPSQVPIQTRSFVCLGGGDGGAGPEPGPDPSPEPGPDTEPPGAPEPPAPTPGQEAAGPVPPAVAEVLAQPVAEAVCLTPGAPAAPRPAASRGTSLIEVSLSDLEPPERAAEPAGGEAPGAAREPPEDEQKVCCGFFFKDDQKAEDDMALKRAALLEKRLRREKETQLRRQQQEAELEHRKEETRRKTEEERQRKEEERARREFIRQEYLRRKQLKLMEAMDSVLRPRPAPPKPKKPRPKSVHRDHVEPPKTPTQGPPVSSLSLASLNTGDSESVLSGKRTPRSESVEGFLSPSRCGSRNGEKDWENASTTSSVASGTEYTGPKLYREPSAKSNKHIVQNALAHCCLAGRVNEGQKQRVLEEMEKSDANNFLILFRDSGCQFRALYTYCPETEDIAKLTGIGPKAIAKKMIEGLYKYSSDRKQFSHIPAKTLSASVDAITIHSHLWQSRRPGTPRKLLPAKA